MTCQRLRSYREQKTPKTWVRYSGFKAHPVLGATSTTKPFSDITWCCQPNGNAGSWVVPVLGEPSISSCSSCFRVMMFRHPSEVSGSRPSYLGDALESTVRVKSMTPMTGAAVDGLVQVITNNTSAYPISLSALISSCPCVPEPARKTHISLAHASGGPVQSSGQGCPWNPVSISALQSTAHVTALLWIMACLCTKMQVHRSKNVAGVSAVLNDATPGFSSLIFSCPGDVITYKMTFLWATFSPRTPRA